MNRILIILSLYCQALTLWPVFAATVPESSTDSLRIGFIGPLSGTDAIYGVAAKNGIELALAELGAGSGLEFIFENNAADPKKTVTAFNKLVDVDKAHVVISLAASPSHAIAPLAEARGVPLLTWTSDPKVSKGRRFVLRTYPSSDAEGSTIAQEVQRRGHEAVGIFTSASDYAATLKMGFIRRAPKRLIAYQEELPAEVKDFRDILLKAKAKNIKACLICLNPGQSGLFAKQARALKLGAPIFGCEFINNSAESKIAAGALNSAWFVTTDINQRFRQSYREKFKNEDLLSAAAIHYDLVHVLHRLTPFKGSARDLVDRIYSAGNVTGGGLLRAKFRSTGNDRFLDTTLIVQEISH